MTISYNLSIYSDDGKFIFYRNGQRNGFNFNEHKNDKIGILRAYNKKNRKSDGGLGAITGKGRRGK
jgi:hypothetical protein